MYPWEVDHKFLQILQLNPIMKEWQFTTSSEIGLSQLGICRDPFSNLKDDFDKIK